MGWFEIEAGDWLEDDVVGLVRAFLAVNFQVTFLLEQVLLLLHLRAFRLHFSAVSAPSRDPWAIKAERVLVSKLYVALRTEVVSDLVTG